MLIKSELFNNSKHQPLYPTRHMEALLIEWRNCKDLKYKADALFTLLLPNLINWVKMLTRDSEKTIEYYSLVGRINHPDPVHVLRLWVQHNKEDLLSILFECYLAIARKGSVITTNNETLPFLISRYFVLRLANKIRDWSNQHRKEMMFESRSSMDNIKVDVSEAELLLEYELQKLNSYDYYVVSLFRADLDRDKLFDLTHSHYTRNYIRRWLDGCTNKTEAD